MAVVMQRTADWIANQPFWEQAALDQILTGMPVIDADCERFLQFMLEDAKLTDRTSTRPQLREIGRAAQAVDPSAPQPMLLEISNVQNVNALASSQTLTFGPALTLVYGENGSGKSGYARLLGCAGFTRGDRELLPNVMEPASTPQKPACADIEIDCGGVRSTHHYEHGEHCADLARFYVFDSTSVLKHLTAANQFSFSPAGLQCLSDLAAVGDRIGTLLTQRIDSYRHPHALAGHFDAESTVGQQIAGIGAKTNLDDLQQHLDLPVLLATHVPPRPRPDDMVPTGAPIGDPPYPFSSPC